jgi:hypothetical protein
MNSFPLDGALGIGAIVGVMALINIGWHVAVIVLLAKVWLKVRHLPS